MLLKKLLHRRFDFVFYFLLIDLAFTAVLFNITYPIAKPNFVDLTKVILFLVTYIFVFTFLCIKGKLIVKIASFTYIIYSILDLLCILFVLFLDSRQSTVLVDMNSALTIVCCVTILIFVRILTPFMIKGYSQVVNAMFILKQAEDNEVLISKISSSRSGIFDNSSVEDG